MKAKLLKKSAVEAARLARSREQAAQKARQEKQWSAAAAVRLQAGGRNQAQGAARTAWAGLWGKG